MYSCVQCQSIFKPLRTNKNKPRKFCSMLCSSEHSKKKTITKCLNCGTDTYNPKFCNSSCAATFNNSKKPKRQKQYKVCVVCGTSHIRKNSKYCSDFCNPRKLNMSEEEKIRYIRSRKNESWARYMAKKKNQTPADADIAAIQDFYLNCPPGHEVDHIIPISKGGLHTLSNLQYLTISENRKKSNKIL
jgi:5-methylcytosine-specific restriction endonuclease McrA